MEYMIGLFCLFLLYISMLLFNYNRIYFFYEYVDNLFLFVKIKNFDIEMIIMILIMVVMIVVMVFVILK